MPSENGTSDKTVSTSPKETPRENAPQRRELASTLEKAGKSSDNRKAL